MSTKTSIRKFIAILLLIGMMASFTGLALAAPSTSFQLIAFGVKPNTGGTFSGQGGDIGWARGNSDKGWHEGAWIPIKIVITDVQTSYPGLAGFPTINLGYDFTGGGDRFIDLVRDIQIGTTDLSDSQGWPQTNGTTSPVINASALPQSNITQVEAAQDSIGEGQWPGYILAETLTGWDPTKQVNTNYSGGSGTPTDGSHQITITAAQIQEWATNTGSTGADTIIIYAQMHLARTFIWSNGLESGYASGSPGSAITYPEGGWVYGTSPYTGASADKRNGSGFVSGSSGHMYFNMTGIGADTTQLPVPPQPPGVVSGYKWQDDNDNGVKDGSEIFLANWGIHISGTLEGGIEFTDEIFTDASGAYNFTNLTAGFWTVREHNHIGVLTTPPPPVWIETYPSLDNPGGTIGQGVAGPVTNIDPFDFAPYGWYVTLTDAIVTQGGLNFGNFQGIPDTMVSIDASIDGQLVDTVYAGGTVTLTITEENTGQLELTGAYVAVSGGVGNLDDTSSGWSSDFNGDNILEPGETWSWVIDVTVNSDTAFVALGHGFDPQNNDISYVNGYDNERDEFDVYAISPAISIEKLVDCDDDGVFHTEETVDGPTDNAHWYVKVTNTGDSPVYDIVVTDDMGTDFGAPFDLDTGDYVEFDYYTLIDQTTTNTAYAEGTDELGGPVGPVQASATNNIINPMISIEKLVDCDGDGEYHDQETVYGPTDNADWYVVVTNTGNTPLYNIVVTDTSGYDFGDPFDLDPGDYAEFYYTTLINQTTTNTAYAEAEDELGFAVGPVQASATNKLINPEISIEKLVDCDSDGVYHDHETVYGPTDDADWYVVVTNTGDSPVYDIMVSDNSGYDFGDPFDLLPGQYAEFYYTTAINQTTTNTAYADGVDEIDGQVGPVQSSATNYLINPYTIVGILPSADTVYENDVVTLEIVELNTGDVPLTDVYAVVDDGMGGSITLDETTAVESGINDDILEVGESWTWYVDVVVNDDTTYTVNGHGTDPLGNDVSYANGYLDEQTDVFVDVIHPSTTMQLFTYVYDAVTGNVTLTITDKNDGDVPLYNAHVHVLANGVAIPGSPFLYNQGDSWSASGGSGNNADNIMDPGESWTWVITVTIYETTFFETWGHATDPLGNPVDYDPENGLFLSEYMSTTVEVGGLTRTQGFWATHLNFTSRVLDDYLPGGINLGWLPQITNINDLMGVFWANNAKESDGTKRSALCQAKEIASNQALAAILNSSIPGGKALPSGYSLTQIATILAGNNINAIKKLNSDLDNYNNSGEDVAFDPSLLPIGRATPTQAKSIANIPFANCP